MTKSISISLASAFFLSGCFNSTPEAMSAHMKKISDQNITSMTNGELTSTIAQVHVKKANIDISVQKTLKMILHELQLIENNIYMLADGSKNIDIPINSKFKIDSFQTLVMFLEATTDYTLIIKQNKYRKDLPKIIEVVHKKSVQNDIDKHSVPIEIKSSNSTMTAKDALVAIAKSIKFSLVFKHNDFPETKTLTKNNGNSFQTTQTNSGSGDVTIFDNAIINFYGDTLSDFFNYIENSFDVFINVDYGKKQIVVSKIKTSFLKLAMPNIELTTESTSGSAGLTSTGGGQTVEGAMIESTIAIKMYEQLEEKLSKIFNNDSNSQMGGVNSNSTSSREYYDIDTNNGEVLIVAGHEKLERSRKVIDSFNESYSKNVYVDFRVYEVLVYAENKLGSAFSGTSDKFSLNVNPEVTGFMSYLDSITDTFTLKSTLESLHTYGHILKGYKAESRLINNIPKSIQLITSDDYVSKITNNTTTSTGTVNTELSNEVATLQYGKTITLKPKVYDDSCAIEIDYESSGKPNMKDRVIGSNTIQISENKTKDKYRDIVRLKNKETVIINVIEEFVSANDYKGLLPIQNFVVGGSEKNQYLKKEIIFLLSLNQIGDN
jgi:hypothetical protein